MPILIWIVAIVGLVVTVASIWWLIWAARRDAHYFDYPKALHIVVAIVVAIIGVALIVGPMYWLYGTEPGQRDPKSFASETGGGLERTVEVYDLQGDLIKTYEGKFDIQEDSTKVFFDLPTEDGGSKRVQIYNATVIVEEE